MEMLGTRLRLTLLTIYSAYSFRFFFFQAEDGIRDVAVTGVQTCALPIWDRDQLVVEHDREVLRGRLDRGPRQLVGLAALGDAARDVVPDLAALAREVELNDRDRKSVV